MDRSVALASYVECQFREHLPEAGDKCFPFVTISRQTGAGGITIGERLAQFLRQKDSNIKCACPWSVFDKELVTEVLKKHHLPERIAPFLSEDKISEIEDIMDGLFGLHPAKWTLVHKTSQMLLNLAHMGYVILVGRGANVVTRKLPGGFHVRLVGSFKKRLEHVKEYYHLDAKNGKTFIQKEDIGRKNYLKKYFGKDINDPLLYDLVINTDTVSYSSAAEIIANAVLKR